jgi:hypothetical protein
MFPRGAPGFALLLLRASVTASILLHTGSEPHRGAWMLALTLALSTALCAGFLTPIAALLAMPAYLIETANLRVAPADVVAAVLQALALSLLGPGACSIDARLYGRRVVVLPQKRDRDTG